MVTHVLELIAVGAVRALVLVLSPIRRCSWCKGTLRARKHRYWGPVTGCRKCKGYRKHYRFGAATVHKARQIILEDMRERRK